MKFKAGDKVRVRKDLIDSESYDGMSFVPTMRRLEGQTVTIAKANQKLNAYDLEEDGGSAFWTDGMLEPVEDSLVKKIEERNNKHTDVSTTDKVNSPSHYQVGEIETIDIIQTMLTPEEYVGFIKGNIIKYRERAPYKGQSEEDYKKAKKYYDILKEIENEK